MISGLAASAMVVLHGDCDVPAGDRLFDLLAPLADHHDLLVGAERIDATEEVEKQRPAGDRVQDLVRVRAHARALAGGEDDNGKAALIAHGIAHGGEQ